MRSSISCWTGFEKIFSQVLSTWSHFSGLAQWYHLLFEIKCCETIFYNQITISIKFIERGATLASNCSFFINHGMLFINICLATVDIQYLHFVFVVLSLLIMFAIWIKESIDWFMRVISFLNFTFSCLDLPNQNSVGKSRLLSYSVQVSKKLKLRKSFLLVSEICLIVLRQDACYTGIFQSARRKLKYNYHIKGAS